ncbi:hypothetical protein FO519_003779 [Halicephalobus sp. NKZ332]|nr:hypothetical protein FO519_003779 [Halicephalobus sp. NKZ332]
MRRQLNVPLDLASVFVPFIFLLCSVQIEESHALKIPFELDTDLPTVTCRKCVQLWTNPDDSPYKCGPNSETCTGTACFMRQCKRCGLYQYISGCVRLTDWQLRDLQISRQRVELMNTRAGASMLCEDNNNHTTCICNRRDRCNDIHVRIPFSTYQGNLFRGILNIDAAINDFDGVLPRMHQPRHMFVGHWYPTGSTTSLTLFPLIFCHFALFLLKMGF